MSAANRENCDAPVMRGPCREAGWPYDWQKETPVLQGVSVGAAEGTRTPGLLRGKVDSCDYEVVLGSNRRFQVTVTKLHTRWNGAECSNCDARVMRPVRNIRRLGALVLSTSLLLAWNYATAVPWWVWALAAAGALGWLVMEDSL